MAPTIPFNSTGYMEMEISRLLTPKTNFSNVAFITYKLNDKKHLSN